MSKLTCPSCGYEFPETAEQIKHFNEEVNKAVKAKETEIAEKIRLEMKKQEAESSKSFELQIAELKNQLKLQTQQQASQIKEETSKKDQEIAELKSKLKNAKTEQELAVSNSLKDSEKTIEDLKHTIEIDRVKSQSTLKEELDKITQKKQAEIDDLQRRLDVATDYKTRMNVKDLGEDLEQYCENKFNSIRANVYPSAYFAKDSDTSINGEKGDYIFRDYVGEGENRSEFISIMFDMKNEDAEAKTKHKNMDFFKKLDSDRKAKNCEYAVLVSMLEQGNELYDQGITDVSYAYPKMFVVRPQHFLTIISLLRSISQKNATNVLQLAEYKNKNADLVALETAIADFKTDVSTSVNRASKNFQDAIDDIDKTIKNLTDMRAKLVLTGNQLATANNKVQNVTVKKLISKSDSLKEEYKQIKKDQE